MTTDKALDLTNIEKFFTHYGIVGNRTRYAKYLNQVRNKIKDKTGKDLHPDVYSHFQMSKQKVNAEQFFNQVNEKISYAVRDLKKNNNVKENAKFLLESIIGEIGSYFMKDASSSDFAGINPKEFDDYKNLSKLWEKVQQDLQQIIQLE